VLALILRMPGRGDPFPFEAARDLLGILRALYAATEREGGSKRRLEAIQRCGRELGTAIALARQNARFTLGHDAAWRRAEAATRQAMDLIESTTPIEPTLTAAVARIWPRAVGSSRRRDTGRH
jgi:hypothetical protein